MANLSNINNILRTGSLGVGINRDPLGAFEISSATKPGVKMFNTSTNGKTYEAYSDTNGNYIIYDQDADDNRFVINTSGNAIFAGEIRTTNRLAIKETYFGYSSGYKVIQVGESAATKSISLGYDPSGNTSGSFSGNEILIPNNIRILAPAANNSGYYGLMMLNSSNKVLLGASNYLMESNYIMALDTATKNVGIGTDSPGTKLEIRQVDDTFDDLDLLTLKRVWSTASGSDRAHGIVFNDVNSKMATIYADRTNSGSNYNSQLLFSVNSGTSGTSMITPMVINNLGRVGIGTTSPSTKLELYGDTSSGGFGAYPALTIKNDNASGFSAVHFNQSTSQKARIEVSNSAGSMGLYTTSAANGILINNSGNVGIGTTNPGATLDVDDDNTGKLRLLRNGSVRAEFSNNANEGELSLYRSSTVKTVYISSYYNSYFNGGNVGIGTISPSPKLHLQYAGGDYSSDSASGFINEATTGRGTMRIRSATDNPAELFFDVNGAIRWDISCRNGTSPNLHFYPQAATPSLAGVSAHTFELQQNGNVIVTGNGSSGRMGIGTSVPSGKLNIVTTGNHLHIRNSGATAGQYWNFDVASQNRLYILNHVNTGVYISSGDTSWTANSDESLKENINNLQNVLPIIDNYRCVKYNLISNPEQIKIGFIAQDWQEDFPEIINTDKNNKLGMKYTETIPILLKAIQELKADNDSLKARIETLENN